MGFIKHQSVEKVEAVKADEVKPSDGKKPTLNDVRKPV